MCILVLSMQHLQENTKQGRQGHDREIEVIWNNQERLKRVQEEGGAENCWIAEVIDRSDNEG